ERLHRWLTRVDAQGGKRIAPADRHRVERALEVWMTGGRPISKFERQSERPSIKIALSLDRQALTAALDRRVEEMYSAGLIDETKRLLGSYPRSAKAFSTIG